MRKVSRLFAIVVFLLGVWLVAGCSSRYEAEVPASPPLGASRSAKSEAAADIAAAKRPGLGTEFGENRQSRVTTRGFERQNWTRPWLLASVHYNDEEGVSAAGAGHGRKGFVPLNGLVDFAVTDGNGSFLQIASQAGFWGKPDYSVIGRAGQRYELRFKNNTDTRLEIVASVDGLDVLDGKPAAITKRGYLVEPGSGITIDGWRTSLNSVAAFRFGSVENSYAGKKYGDSRNVGVIGIAVFYEAGARPRPYLEHEINRRKKADPFPNSGGFAEPPG